MIYIKYASAGEDNPKMNELEIAASGKTYKDALGNLIAALNHDEIDIENNFLLIQYENNKRTRNNKSQT